MISSYLVITSHFDALRTLSQTEHLKISAKPATDQMGCEIQLRIRQILTLHGRKWEPLLVKFTCDKNWRQVDKSMDGFATQLSEKNG